MDQKAIALAAAKALDAKRGKDIVVLKVDEMTVITDYMVIATGRSVPQVKALAENVEEELAKLDLFARRREGVNEGLVHPRLRRRDGAYFPRAGSRILSA